jgi:hypothetical protein
MFRALHAHLQEAPHKQQLVYCVRIMSAGCYQGWRSSVWWVGTATSYGLDGPWFEPRWGRRFISFILIQTTLAHTQLPFAMVAGVISLHKAAGAWR